MEDAPRSSSASSRGARSACATATGSRATRFVKDDAGEVVELRCTYDPQTRGGDSPPPDAEGNGAQGQGHDPLGERAHAEDGEVRLYDRLFTAEKPGKATDDTIDDLNPDSLEVIGRALLEPNWGRPTPSGPRAPARSPTASSGSSSSAWATSASSPRRAARRAGRSSTGR
jgi:glutaminyl-tRNA synthetase